MTSIKNSIKDNVSMKEKHSKAAERKMKRKKAKKGGIKAETETDTKESEVRLPTEAKLEERLLRDR